MPIPVFYSPSMVSSTPHAVSPSAGKPAAVIAQWRQKFNITEKPITPLAPDDIKIAHDAEYVDDVLNLVRPNGFGGRDAETAATLPYTSGAMLSAAIEAIYNRKVAVAPVSGFHHACYDRGGGFCTFNGLMITALWLLEHHPSVQRVGILDLDQHYGNGTDSIIDVLKVNDVVHYSGGTYQGEATPFLEDLPDLIERTFKGCDVLLYQAGADPHIDDPLGGWMTTQQLLRRDYTVFRVCLELGIPVAWDLAGGYQEPLQKVLDIHNNTMWACQEVYV